MDGLIRVVKGDEKPDISLTLTDQATGQVIDVSDSNVSVGVRFRAVGGTTVSSIIQCSKIEGGSAGRVSFNFSGGVLDVDEGEYEGQVFIDFNGEVLTVFHPLRFRVRDSF